MPKITPSKRTRDYLVEKGYSVALVERSVQPARVGVNGEVLATGPGFKKDAFGIIDYLAIKPGEIVGVQSCGTDYGPHLLKLTQKHPDICREWLLAGGRLVLIGWRQLKATGWTPRIKWFHLEDFPEEKAVDRLIREGGDPRDAPRIEAAGSLGAKYR